MKDTIKLDRRRQPRAEGRVRIDLTDVKTNKIIHTEQGKNHVFTDALFTENWIDTLSKMALVLTDSTDAIDPDFPFIPPNWIGCGIPSESGSGVYRGGSTANQVLAERTQDSIRWLFQYEFTGSQANGTIRGLGLTNMVDDAYGTSFKTDFLGYGFYSGFYGMRSQATNGEKTASCANSVVTVTDNATGVQSTVDLTSIITSSSNQQTAYDPITGRYYVVNMTGATSTYAVYEFSDITFSTLLNTYPIPEYSGTPSPSSIDNYPMYVRGTKLYVFYLQNVGIVDLANNGARTTQALPLNFYARSTSNNVTSHVGGTIGLGKYVISYGGDNYASTVGYGYIYDLTTETYCSTFRKPHSNSNNNFHYVLHPHLQNKTYFWANPTSTTGLTQNAYVYSAITLYKLASPVTKTSANGMVVTYELEVFW